MSRQCPRCGHLAEDLDHFCASCGAELAPSPDAAFQTGVLGVRIASEGDSAPLPTVDPTSVGGLGRGHAVLVVLRGQVRPTEDQLDEFFGAFGRLVLATEDGAAHYASHLHQGTVAGMAVETQRYLTRAADNRGSSIYDPGEDGASELVWHNDQSHRPMRKVVSVFEALEVDDGVVPTEFRDMYTAYETLPVALRTLLENRLVVYYDPRLPSPAELPRLADATHPVFTPHPHTGRRTIYVNDFADRFTGLTHAESAETMDALRAHVDTHAPRVAHQWRSGDIAVWDNIGLQHRRDAVPGGQKRHMRQYGGLAE